MSKHTPGPWDITISCTTMGEMFGVPGSKRIRYWSYNLHQNETEVEAEANARLIATAPELLEALKSALQTAEFERHPHRGWQDEAKAAIAKAEGA